MSRVPRNARQTDATVTFTYESAYNQLVQPGSYVSLSQYFIAHWMPHISGPGLKILIQLRSMGYYNPKAGVQRGDIDIDQKELAALCGLSLSTLKRAFQDDAVLTQYVQRVFEVRRDPRTGRILKEHYVYAVKMDDALTPDDKQRLEGMLHGPDKPGKEPENPEKSPIGQNELSGADPIAQNEPSAGQNEPPIAQNEPSAGQNDLPFRRNGGPNTLNTLDTSYTPGAAPDVFASLLSEEEGKEPTVRSWADLTEPQRAPWLDKAEAELKENFGGAMWAKTKEKARASIRGQRAVNLYLEANDEPPEPKAV